jgi:autotransporter strand-loop-strand O-heptosyltransferase
MQKKIFNMLERKIKINIIGDSIEITNISGKSLENCLIEVKNIFNNNLIFEKFDLKKDESKIFNFIIDNFYNECKHEKFYVKVYSNHKKIYEKTLNDKSKCFVLLSNQKFEALIEQLVVGLDRYTELDILHYTIGYKSEMNYTNLKNIELEIPGYIDDSHFMQFSKALVFLDVISKGYENGIFLDADIQVRSNINEIVDYIYEIEDGPILQKNPYDFMSVNGQYIPGPQVKSLLDISDQPYSNGVTNIVIFNKSHKNLFEIWEKVCFSPEIQEIKKTEFLHDESLLNCLMWKYKIKPKLFNFAINISDLKDVKFFFNYNNIDMLPKTNMNEYECGHVFQSFIPYNKSEVKMFHCVKDIKVAKEINDYIYQREVEDSFEDRIINFYENINKRDIREMKNDNIEIIDHNIDGALIEIKADSRRKFTVKFYDEENNLKHHSEINGNMWTKTNISYFIKWRKIIEEEGKVIYDSTTNLENKRVLICLESSSLGDTLAWMPYADEFRKKHNCKVILSTFNNELFEKNYPELEFMKPGMVAHNLHAIYRIGWFYTENGEVNLSKNPKNFRMQPMQKTASDILGLEFKEVKPILNLPNVSKLKKVGIAIHGTAQSKYWNNPTGWQEVVDYLNNLGYEVMLYSKEGDNYMGNKHPVGITKFKGGTLQEVIDDLVTCEFFIGIGSGLSWLSWACNLPTIIISGFSFDYTETQSNTLRVINNNVCTGCFNTHRLDPGDWNWCPINKGTERHFECTKTITSEMVIEKIDELIGKSWS